MKKPIRMCIVCRKRKPQTELIRLKFLKEKQKITEFNGYGRSFYICHNCIDSKRLLKALKKHLNLSNEQALKQASYLKGLYG